MMCRPKNVKSMSTHLCFLHIAALQVIAEEQKTDTPPSAHTDPAEADTLTFE